MRRGGNGGGPLLLWHQRDLAAEGDAVPAAVAFHMGSEHVIATPGPPYRGAPLPTLEWMPFESPTAWTLHAHERLA